ncbi:MAG: DUF935 family protein [Rhodothermia bacterium]|nr:DUF935 family protein [Rhodothermia bacterium]
MIQPKTRVLSLSNAFSVVKPADIQYARKAAIGGNPARFFAVLEFFYTYDDVIAPALESLVAAVAGDIEVATIDDSQAASAQREIVEALLEKLDVRQIVESLMLGHYYGVAAHELVWDVARLAGRDVYAPLGYNPVPRSWIYAKQDGDYNRLFIGDARADTYDPGAVLLYTAEPLPVYQNIDFTQLGCGLAAARHAVFSFFGVEDWAAYNESFGQPALIGTLLQGYSDTDKTLLENAIFGLASDSRAIISERTKISTLEHSTGSTSAAYDAFLQRCERARSRIIKSESMTDNDGKTGTYGAMTTANGIRLDVAQKLAVRMNRLLNTQLIAPFLQANGLQNTLVGIRLIVRALEDQTARARIFREARALGVPLSLAQIRAELNLDTPIDAEDALNPPTSNPLLAGI